MTAPWEKYQSEPTQDVKPWEKYSVENIPEQDNGFFSRVGSDLGNRKGQITDAAERYIGGDQDYRDTVLQTAGAVAGGATDLAGNVVGSVGRYARDLVPQPVDDAAVAAIDAAKKYALDTSVGKKAVELAGRGAEEYRELEKNDPVTAANVGSLVNLAGAVPVAKGAMAVGEVAGDVGKAGLKNLATPKQVGVGAEDLRSMGSAAYKKASATGNSYTPDVTNKFLADIDAAKPEKIAGKYLSKEDQRFIDSLEEFKVLADTPLSIDDIDAIDKKLGNKISEAYRRGENYDAGKLSDIQNNLRNLIEDSPGGEALDEARKLWSANYKMQDIERILKRAEGADNPATVIKNGFMNLGTNAKKIKSYTKKERELIDKAAKTGIATDVLRVVGSRLNPIIGAGVGGLDSGIGAYVASAAGRGGAGYLQAGRAGRLAKEVTGGITKSAEPNMINRVAQGLLDRLAKGEKIKNSEISKLSPEDAKLVLTQVERMRDRVNKSKQPITAFPRTGDK